MIRLEYDTAGKLVKVEGGLVNGSAAVRRRRIITLAYTGTKVTSISEPQLARTYTYTYDPTGRLDTVTDPEGGVVNYDYNATTGLLSKVTDARNQATDVAYETSAPAYHRVTSVIRPADGAGRRPTIGFSYNQSVSQPSEDGDVTVLRGARHTGTLNADWRYVTNDEDRVKYSRAPDPNLNDSSVNGQKMSRGFDPTGNVNSFTSGETTSFTYDNAARTCPRRRVGA